MASKPSKAVGDILLGLKILTKYTNWKLLYTILFLDTTRLLYSTVHAWGILDLLNGFVLSENLPYISLQLVLKMIFT